MFVLQRVQDAQVTYTSYATRSEMYSDVRGNYGLSETEFLEFVFQTYFVRENIYLGSYEGDIPAPEESFAKAARNAQASQRARKAVR